MEMLHVIACCLESESHRRVAISPLARSSKLFLDFLGVEVFVHHGEIVTELAMLTWDAHVIHILASGLVRYNEGEIACIH